MLNSQHLVVDQNYRIELYERFKKHLNLPIFKARMKEKDLSTDNELDYFKVREVIKKQPKDKTYVYFVYKGTL